MDRGRWAAAGRKALHALAMLVGVWIVYAAAQYHAPMGLRTMSRIAAIATSLYALPLVVSWTALFFHVRAGWVVWVLAVGFWTFQNVRVDSPSTQLATPAAVSPVAPEPVAPQPLPAGYKPGPPPPPPPPQWRRFTSIDDRYSLELPEDWVIVSAQDAAFVVAGRLQSTPATCLFRDATPSPVAMTRKAIEAELRMSMPDLETFNVATRPLAGKSAKAVSWNGSRDGVSYVGTNYVRTGAGPAGRGLAMSCSSEPRDHMKDALKQFDRMAESLRLSE